MTIKFTAKKTSAAVIKATNGCSLNIFAGLDPWKEFSNRITAKPIVVFERIISSASFEYQEVNSCLSNTIANLPRLNGDLERVLFSPGVHYFKDPRTGKINFSEYFASIPQPKQMNFDNFPPFIQPSKDSVLSENCAKIGCRFTSSTSAISSSLSLIHQAISGRIVADMSRFSQVFNNKSTKFTAITGAPCGIIIKKLPNDVYSVERDSSFSDENILQKLGTSMEHMLTNSEEQFKKKFINILKKSITETNKIIPETSSTLVSETKQIIAETKKIFLETKNIIPETIKRIFEAKKMISDSNKKKIPETNEETILETKKNIPGVVNNNINNNINEKKTQGSYFYGRAGSFLLRAQLDCAHDLLPKGVFDIKTRATLPIRMNVRNYQDNLSYSIIQSQGMFYSFEREYHDMVRSAFLRYSFQLQIGMMDGIFVAYHNTSEIFGFEYIPREEIEKIVFGSPKKAKDAFAMSLQVLEEIATFSIRQFEDADRIRVFLVLDNQNSEFFVEKMTQSDSDYISNTSTYDPQSKTYIQREVKLFDIEIESNISKFNDTKGKINDSIEDSKFKLDGQENIVHNENEILLPDDFVDKPEEEKCVEPVPTSIKLSIMQTLACEEAVSRDYFLQLWKHEKLLMKKRLPQTALPFV